MTEAVRSKARPFFGICVGMQLMATRGKEHVTTDGFNWIAGDVEKISPREENLKIPHMGWNTLDMVREHRCWSACRWGRRAATLYFVHTYHLNATNEADVLCAGGLWRPVTAIVGKDTRHRHATFIPRRASVRAGPDFELFEMEAVILFPAIDLKNGQCVRLEQGDMARATVFNLDPAAQARAFAPKASNICTWSISTAPFAGKPMNAQAVESMLGSVTMPVQLGGGIRDLATVEAWLAKGVARVIIGTAAVRDPELVKGAAKKFPGRVAVGLDARDGKVAVEGWAETSEVTALEIAQRFEDAGVAANHLYRHCARRPAERPQPRCHHCAGRAHFNSRHRLGRFCLDRGREGAADAARQKTGRRDRRPARSMMAASIHRRR